MWSMLSRHEVNRRLYRRAVQLGKSLRIDKQELRQLKIDEREFRQLLTEAIAGIWMAYDELGWGGAPTHVLETFEQHGADPSLHEIFYVLRASHRLTSNRSSSELGTWVAILGMLGALFAAYIRTWVQRLENQTAHTIAIVSMLFNYIPIVKISGDIGAFSSSSDAMDIILELQWDLRTLNARSGLLELFPALEFSPEMLWRRGAQGAKTLDIETHDLKPSLSITKMPVTEMEVTELVDQDRVTPDPQQQTTCLVVEADPSAPHPGPLHASSQREADVGVPAIPSYDLIESWLKVAPSLGMNIVFRPRKSIPLITNTPKRHEDRPPHLLLLYSMAFVIVGSYFPAFFLSYFTFWTVGFGCRCLAWTLILSLWLLSLFADAILKCTIGSARKLWYTTVAKDTPVAVFFVGTIIWLQIGWVNSCWCRSKVLGLKSKAVVDLGPANGEEWKRLWILWPLAPLLGVAFTAGLYLQVSRGAKMVLCKDPKERHKDLLVIARLRENLPLGGHQ
ncbi:hypothetical protein FGG08_003290 [Glutinoglossum americanum]|uniref:Uncharacterized protein n=1 Tax=Glutinoglossum americanum TaxID=1670608 RepID=A0A9P8I7I4_9PEZI|nr:hypothetical protein FGG08_003290 [Glutinoglossum americanum]